MKNKVLVITKIRYFGIVLMVLVLVFVLYTLYMLLMEKRQSILRSLAINTVSVFNDVNMHYWVDFGTLLGIVREDDIIRGDNDVDICINDDESSHNLMRGPVTQRLEALGYVVTKETWSAYRVSDGVLCVDIYITKREGDTIIGATGENSNISQELVGVPTKHLWKKPHLYVNTPQNVHETLVWRYGDDYMVPKPGYKGRDTRF